MSIQMVRQGGYSRPAFFCDRCGKVINDLADAVFLWDPPIPDPNDCVYPTKLVHCGECDSGIQACSLELVTGLVYLLYAAGYLDTAARPTPKWKEAVRRVALLSQL